MANTRNTKGQYFASNSNLSLSAALTYRRGAGSVSLVLPCGANVALAKNAAKALLKGNGGKGPQGATFSYVQGNQTLTITLAPYPKATQAPTQTPKAKVKAK